MKEKIENRVCFGEACHPLDGREAQYKSHFVGNGLLTNAPFLAAYEKAV